MSRLPVRRRHGPIATGLALVGLVAAGPASAAVTRPIVSLDGDPDVRTLDSEDVLFERAVQGEGREFGSAVALADVDGDGLADAIVGHRVMSRILIYLGSGSPSTAPWFGDPGAADIIITAPGGGTDRIEQFGFSVAGGDLDGDGFADLVVGAPFSDPGGSTDAGRAFIILGRGNLSAGQNFAVTAPPAGVVVLTLTRGGAARAGDLLGFSVGTGRLQGGDAYAAVSARGADAPARTDAGAVHVVRGSALPATGGPFDLTTGSAVTFFGADAADAFGEAIASCDVDGAGSEDLVVGAIFGDGPAGAGINRGEVRVFLGENIAGGHFSGVVSAAGSDLEAHGATDGDDLGFAVACGDLDGDARGEIVAGAIFADAVGETRPTAGEVVVLRGRASQADPNTPGRRILIDPVGGMPQAPVDLATTGPDLLLIGATTADQLGFAIAVGDFDGDGTGDLAAAARRYDRDQTRVNVGAVYLITGSPGLLPAPGATRTIDLRQGTARPVYPGFVPGTPIDHLPDQIDGIILGASRDDHMGFAIAAGDLDGRGGDEVLVSAIGDPTRSPEFRGQAYVMAYADHDGDGSSDLQDRDNDNDGIPDEDESAGTYSGGRPTDPTRADTDDDGIQDGTELGFTCTGGGGIVEVPCDDPDVPYTSTDPGLSFFFREDADPATTTDPLDLDSEDDGLADGAEDRDGDGSASGPGETDPALPDTDGDGILDGTEAGISAPHPDTDISAGNFVPDADAGASTTDPSKKDTDGDGLDDGVEDADRDGAVLGDVNFDYFVNANEIWLESDPADPDTDRDGLRDGHEVALGSNPVDQDSDDDGLPDGWIDGANGGPLDGMRQGREGEDLNGDGVIGPGESDPSRPDTDGDGILDGTERGLNGGGVAGRNGTPDAGAGGDGTDPTSPNRPADADMGASTTDPGSADSDGDGIPDGVEDADRNGAVAGDLDLDHEVDPTEIWTETDPADPDTDRDGIPDGLEDADRDGVRDPGETDPLDQDSDDDGLPDGWIDGANGGAVDMMFEPREGEDADRDGVFGTNDGESHPLLTDSDGDGLPDGVEAGVVAGGGVPGRNGTPDAGPGGDGTDTTSPAFRVDADPATTTLPWDADTDDDGLPDGFIDGFNPNPGGTGGILDGVASVFEGEDLDLDGAVDPGETNPADRDSDLDGVKDGAERGVSPPGVLGPDLMPDPVSGGVQDGTRAGANALDADETTLTDPLDADSDDDGRSDGAEDRNENGAFDPGGAPCTTAETDASRFDTDGDLLGDGLECGRTTGVTGTDPGVFVPDLDPATITDPNLADTDGGSRTDGDEDADRNGRVDPGERDPNVGGDDDRDGEFTFTDALDGAPVVTAPAAGAVFLRLIDQDEDPDPNLTPAVGVSCTSDFPDSQAAMLQDSSPAERGRFVGSVPTTTGATGPDDGTLSVSPGGSVTCTYQDDNDPPDLRMASLGVTLSGGDPPPDPDLEIASSGILSWGFPPASRPPAGPVGWNVYRGNPRALAETGVYTQHIVACGLGVSAWDDPVILAPEEMVFYLVSATSEGQEGGLGTDSAGRPRPFSQACVP